MADVAYRRADGWICGRGRRLSHKILLFWKRIDELLLRLCGRIDGLAQNGRRGIARGARQ